jgi:[ribosomal protein S18]-alanine N-acetyltransferase
LSSALTGKSDNDLQKVTRPLRERYHGELDFSIRRADFGDLRGIAAVERAGFGRSAWPRALFLEYLETCGHHFLVALHGQALVAYLIACRRGPRGEIVSLAVLPPFRGSGVAQALMNRAIAHLRRAGADRVSLMVKVANHRAIAFYIRLGFRRVRRVREYYEDGRDGWLMTRRFTD